MAKTWLYRLFGIGKIPKKRRVQLERERIVLSDEGISGSIVFTKFRAPGRYHGKRWSWFSGALVLTKARLVAFTGMTSVSPIIDIPLDNPRLAELDCSLRSDTNLTIGFDAARFNDRWSGKVECRFETEHARQFLREISKKIADLERRR